MCIFGLTGGMGRAPSVTPFMFCFRTFPTNPSPFQSLLPVSGTWGGPPLSPIEWIIGRSTLPFSPCSRRLRINSFGRIRPQAGSRLNLSIWNLFKDGVPIASRWYGGHKSLLKSISFLGRRWDFLCWLVIKSSKEVDPTGYSLCGENEHT